MSSGDLGGGDLNKRLCFIDMPFGRKVDSKSGVEIDFDQIYEQGIRPAVTDAGLACVRGDEERTGGIIHKAMFARLLLCDFVIADMTTANANVFYELGVRHAAKPYTTIPIFATIGAPPFDVGLVRAIPYELEKGVLSDAAAADLKQALRSRMESALAGPVTEDSPLFQLFNGFPGIEISHELTDVFRDRVEYSARFKELLAEARDLKPAERAVARLKEIEAELGDLKTIERAVLVDLLLSYRDVSAWDEMVRLWRAFPDSTAQAVICRQQYALALNRQGKGPARREAVQVLRKLIAEHGPSAETYGILGRVYKDEYSAAKEAGSIEAAAFLDEAIESYTKGFEAEPADYYPGVNAVNLLLQKGDEASLKEVDRLTPLVSFAVARRGGMTSEDYWDLATVLELALIGRDAAVAEAVLPKVCRYADADWKAGTTARNLEMVLELRRGKEATEALERAVAVLRQKEKALRGE